MESLDTIFFEARALSSPIERAAYLAQACGADAEMRARVEAMLREAEAADAFFAPPAEALDQTVFVSAAEGAGGIMGRPSTGAEPRRVSNGTRFLVESYRVQYSENLSANAWTDLAGDVSATSGTASETDKSPSNASQRFYRVVLLP